MWLLILHGFLASTGMVWLFVLWPLAMSSDPTDPGLLIPYLISTLAASATLVVIAPVMIQKFLRSL